MNSKRYVTLGIVFLIGLSVSHVKAGPITMSDFGSNVQEFDFTGVTSDFTITGGKSHSLGWNFWNSCTIDFSDDMSAVGIFIKGGKTSTVTMEVFDTNGDSLEEHAFSGLSYPGFIGLDENGGNIGSTSFTVNDDIFIGSLLYQKADSISSVPVPGSLSLLGFGLAGFSGVRHRWRNHKGQ